MRDALLKRPAQTPNGSPPPGFSREPEALLDGRRVKIDVPFLEGTVLDEILLSVERRGTVLR